MDDEIRDDLEEELSSKPKRNTPDPLVDDEIDETEESGLGEDAEDDMEETEEDDGDYM